MNRAPVGAVRVVAGLISSPSDGGRYLVQQRPPGKSRALLWEFPGGKVEAGESDTAALAREAQEELGVDLEVGAKLWESTHRYADLEVTLVLYRAAIRQGLPRPLCANELRWLRPQEMRALPFCEADIPLLDQLDGILAA